MPTSPKQAAAEQNIHDMLDAGNPETLTAYADFAAGEIDDKHLAALLLAILEESVDTWSLSKVSIAMADAISRLQHELERQRANFIESEACNWLRLAELNNQVAAEQAYSDHA